MPEPVNELPPPRSVGKHDWSKILDGKVWLLTRENGDYDCDEGVLVGRARDAARNRGGKVKTRYSRAVGQVFIEFIPGEQA